MKAVTKLVFTLALMAAPLLSAAAQSVSELNTLDPVGDSLAINKMRAKMDAIRKHRPTVALVLSGGGAKGAAHIGAIDFIERLGIPVDMVLGTSMGGLIGSLYALGYNSHQMDSLIRSLDWGELLSDNIPSSFRTYQQKRYRETYLFSVPFYYSQHAIFTKEKDDNAKNESNQLLDAVLNTKTDPGHIHIGANDEMAEKTLKDNLFGSLPSGFINGQNVNNLISSLTVGYQDEIDFSELPVPFFCIAGDMVTGKAKLWHSGKLTTALRSTMSIPGIFAPVRVDGMVLVDGGVRNNYPTDVAKAMGADIVIGVELSDAEMTYSDINNIADIVWKFIDILGMDSFQKNINVPDVTIKPDLTEFNMLSFDTKSIDVIIQRGYLAALNKSDELMAVKKKVENAALIKYPVEPALDLNMQKVRISEITFEGLTLQEERYLREKVEIKPGDAVSAVEMKAAVARLYATQSFDYVSYELLGDRQPFRLNFNCRKRPVHQVGVGARFDTETSISAIVNLGFNVHKVEGSSGEISTRIGANPYFDLHYMYKVPKLPVLNFDMKFSDSDITIIGNKRVSDISLTLFDTYQRLYLSDMNWKSSDVKLGVKNNYFRISNFLSAEHIEGSYDIKQAKNDFVSVFLNTRSNTYDDGYFPSKGHNMGISAEYVIGGLLSHIEPLFTLQTDVSVVARLCSFFDFIPSFTTRMLFGKTIPVNYLNLVGGTVPGRYIEQQVPFMGINYATPLKNHYLLYRSDFRFHLTENNYLSAVLNVVKDSNEFDTDLLWTGDILFGAGLEYSYDSIVGPIKLNVHWSNLTNKVGAYFSLGFDF